MPPPAGGEITLSSVASVWVAPVFAFVQVTVEIVLKYVAVAPACDVQAWPLVLFRYQACELIVNLLLSSVAVVGLAQVVELFRRQALEPLLILLGERPRPRSVGAGQR